jgi:polar amino acid transport system substrate-binding protein
MIAPRILVKTAKLYTTTLQLMYLFIFALLMSAFGHVLADEAVATNLPVFRHIDSMAKSPQDLASRSIRLLMDQDFPPFTYEAADGKAAGVSVDLALAACVELKLTCVVAAKKFDELMPALLNNEGDVIVSGLKIDETVLKKTAMTRPYFWSLGRFAVSIGSQIRSSDVRSLAGKRIGFVSNTSHAAWLEKYYSRSTLTAFASEAEMFEALRSGAIEALFGDDLRIVYWLAGSASRGCCKVLDGAYVDRNFFSRNLAFLARREDQSLVQGLDFALDRLQEKGVSGQIFSRYLPTGLW